MSCADCALALNSREELLRTTKHSQRVRHMSSTALQEQAQLRIVCRKRIRPRIDVAVTTLRPSLMDLRLRGDSWIVSASESMQQLYFGDHLLASVVASPFDQATLNRVLAQIRHRYPRRRSAARR